MNENTKFCITIWIIVMIIPMLALTVMQPLPGERVIRKDPDTGTPFIYTITIEEYVAPYAIFLLGTIVIYFFSSRKTENEARRKSK